MLIIIGKYKSKFDFPEENQIVNEILDIIKGKNKSPLTIFGQIEELALNKLNRTDDEVSLC